jgi:hypothetical protein
MQLLKQNDRKTCGDIKHWIPEVLSLLVQQGQTGETRSRQQLIMDHHSSRDKLKCPGHVDHNTLP